MPYQPALRVPAATGHEARHRLCPGLACCCREKLSLEWSVSQCTVIYTFLFSIGFRAWGLVFISYRFQAHVHIGTLDIKCDRVM